MRVASKSSRIHLTTLKGTYGYIVLFIYLHFNETENNWRDNSNILENQFLFYKFRNVGSVTQFREYGIITVQRETNSGPF